MLRVANGCPVGLAGLNISIFSFPKLSINQNKKKLPKMINSDIKNRIIEIIKEEFENPYPKDIFVWDNKEKLKFNRGRFNEFIFNVVENTKEKIIKIIEES